MKFEQLTYGHAHQLITLIKIHAKIAWSPYNRIKNYHQKKEQSSLRVVFEKTKYLLVLLNVTILVNLIKIC